MKVAVIGIGSNSVRMLIAKVEDGKMQPIRREREGTRLFAGLDEKGNLSPAAMETTSDAVKAMAEHARADMVDDIRLFGTSASRDAANGEAFLQLLRDKSGLEMEICSGEREAALSYMGASDGGKCGVIDIGGGSTEIIVGQGKSIICGFSCQMGAVRLFRQMPIAGHGDIPAVEKLADDILSQKLLDHPTLSSPESWYGTGGTFTTLAAMIKGINWTDKTYMHGTVITLEQVQHYAVLLADMPMEERLKLPGLQPHRADIVVHGMCILLAVMKHMGIQKLTVSEYGNLDGYVKDIYL
ncbi:MAG: Ppx/GppA phosphatase family protein [Clostridia bacterium]|nr:Ppx/GppA phosphatase family protein [Clostridia bacterium]